MLASVPQLRLGNGTGGITLSQLAQDKLSDEYAGFFKLKADKGHSMVAVEIRRSARGAWLAPMKQRGTMFALCVVELRWEHETGRRTRPHLQVQQAGAKLRNV